MIGVEEYLLLQLSTLRISYILDLGHARTMDNPPFLPLCYDELPPQ